MPNPSRTTTLTFDCYGTLIDWETGTIASLRPLLARHGVTLSDDEVITMFQDLEQPLCQPPFRPYKAVLAGVVEGFGQRFGFPVGAAERDLLASSIPSWRPFPDTLQALRVLRRCYGLAIISNIDDDLFAATARQLEVPFDAVVTAEQARCYKPDPAIFEEALRRLGVGARVCHARRRGRHGDRACAATRLRDGLGAPERTLRKAADRGARRRSAGPTVPGGPHGR